MRSLVAIFAQLRTSPKTATSQMMRLIAALPFLLASSAHGPLLAQIKDLRSPVAIRLVGDDGLTQKLQRGLEEAVAQTEKFRLASPAEQGLVTVESDTNVYPDTLGGRSVLIYAVRVVNRSGTAVPVTGVCYERAVAKCVTAIMRVVDIRAGRNGS